MRHDADDLNSWDRQPGEVGVAWEAFVAYRDLGPTRSFAKTCREINKGRSLVERWASRYRWSDRVLAYDRYVDEAVQAEVVAAAQDMAARHVRAGRLLQTRAIERLEALGVTSSAKLSGADVVRFLDVGVKIEREALDLPGSSVAVKTTAVSPMPGSLAATDVEQPGGHGARPLGVRSYRRGWRRQLTRPSEWNHRPRRGRHECPGLVRRPRRAVDDPGGCCLFLEAGIRAGRQALGIPGTTMVIASSTTSTVTLRLLVRTVRRF